MLCNACHEREATIHTTLCAPESNKVRDLCSECFESLTLVAGLPCRYCGAPADTSLSDFLEISAGLQPTQAACLACSQDRDDYFQQLLAPMSPELPQERRQLLEDVEAYMKRRVQERRSR